MAEENNSKQDEAAFQVFVRVRPLFSKEPLTSSADDSAIERKTFNTIQIEDNLVYYVRYKWY